jgi:hypothetical protein
VLRVAPAILLLLFSISANAASVSGEAWLTMTSEEKVQASEVIIADFRKQGATIKKSPEFYAGEIDRVALEPEEIATMDVAILLQMVAQINKDYEKRGP